jgi:hypothetical protein
MLVMHAMSHTYMHTHRARPLLSRLVGLPASTTFEELLGKTAAATAKKGAIKTAAGAGGAGTSRVGQTKHITAACHLADGKPLSLVMQVSNRQSSVAVPG